MSERFNSVEEVAEQLQVDKQTVRRWIKEGRLAAVKPGLEWRIRQSDLDEFLEASSYPKVQAPLSSVEEPETAQAERRTPRAEELDEVTAELERLIAQRQADIERWQEAGIDALEKATCGAFEMDRANEQIYRDLRALGADEVIKRRHTASAEDVDAAYRQTNTFSRLIGIAAEARNVRDELSKQVSHEAAGGLPRLEEIRVEESKT